jgi:hypothetical protein
MQVTVNAMGSMETESIAAIDRRWFCRSLAGVAAGATLGISPALAVSSVEPEFVIVNGWVLTRQDIAFVGRLPDAV